MKTCTSWENHVFVIQALMEVQSCELPLSLFLCGFFVRGASHTFPATLNSYHRRLIHLVAEELGLNHESTTNVRESVNMKVLEMYECDVLEMNMRYEYEICDMNMQDLVCQSVVVWMIVAYLSSDRVNDNRTNVE